jgi:hypothetical protein
MNLKHTDINTIILELISVNKDGIHIRSIVEYLDYINKVKYSEKEITFLLKKLISLEKVQFRDGLFYKNPLSV